MKERMTRRQLIKVAALGAGAALAACRTVAPQVVQVTTEVTRQVEVTAVPTKGVVRLQIWNQYPCDDKCVNTVKTDPKQGYQWPMVVQRETFLDKHPGTELVWENHGWDVQLQQNLIAALMAGTQPDVVDGEFQLAQWASLGALIPLDDRMTPEIKENAIPGTYKSTLYKGKIHGLAWTTSVFGFMGRKDILGESNLNALPTDWDGFLKMCQTVNAKGAGRYWGFPLEGPLGSAFGSYLRASVWFYTNGAEFTKPDVDFYPWLDNPKAQPVWEFIRKLAKLNEPNLFFKTDGSPGGRLQIGKAATMLGATWDATNTYGDKTNNIVPYPCYFGPSPAPTGGTPASCILANLQNAALSTSKNPELAVDWVLNLQRDEVQDKVWFSLRRSLPPTKKALTKFIEAPDNSDPDPANDKYAPPELKAFGKVLRDSKIGVPPIFVQNYDRCWEIMKDIFVDVATTNKPIDQLMKDYQAKVDDLFKKSSG